MDLTALLAAVRVRGYESMNDAQATLALNETQRRVAGGHRWPWLLTEAPLTLAAGQNTVALPAGHTHTSGLWLDDPTRSVRLTELPYAEYVVAREEAPSPGVPCVWSSAIGGQLALAPAPSVATPLILVYWRQAVDLLLGTDVPDVPPAYHDVLVLGACAILAQRQARWDAADRWESMFRDRVRAMAAQDGLEQAATRVTRTQDPAFYYFGRPAV